MPTTEERAANFRAQIKTDLTTTIKPWFPHQEPDVIDAILEQILDDTTFHLEHLLVEIESLQQEVALLREKDST